jgi:hypothetical protein
MADSTSGRGLGDFQWCAYPLLPICSPHLPGFIDLRDLVGQESGLVSTAANSTSHRFLLQEGPGCSGPEHPSLHCWSLLIVWGLLKMTKSYRCSNGGVSGYWAPGRCAGPRAEPGD